MIDDRGQGREVRDVVRARPVSLSSAALCLVIPYPATVSGVSGPGPAEVLEVVGAHTEPDPALHPGRSAVPTPPQPMTSLERADAPLAAGAPAQGRAGSSGPRGSGVSRQHDVPHVTRSGREFIHRRGKPAIGYRQIRRPAEEGDVAIQRGHPEGAIGRAALADLVVGDELRFGLLDLHQASELSGLGQFALAENFRVRLEHAYHLMWVVRVTSEDAGARLGQDLPDHREGRVQPLDEGLDPGT